MNKEIKLNGICICYIAKLIKPYKYFGTLDDERSIGDSLWYNYFFNPMVDCLDKEYAYVSIPKKSSYEIA
ncbi:hypothetical protein GCM10027342_43610 [Photobacterium alginatilyticum]